MSARHSDLRRRLQQHDRAAPRPGTRPHDLYQHVPRSPVGDDGRRRATAADREADLVVGLRPPFNASLTGDGRWVFVVVHAAGESAVRFDLADDVGTGAAAARAYGCFPHLGVGVSSARRDCLQRGLRRVPPDPVGRVRRTRPSLPRRDRRKLAAGDVHGRRTRRPRRPTLHAFLSGTSRRLLAELDVEVGRRDPFMQPALARDRVSAGAFFTHGPAALRGLRRRHGLPAQPVPRATIEALLAREVPRRDRRLHDPRAARSDGGTPRLRGRRRPCRSVPLDRARHGRTRLEPAPTARPARRSHARSARAEAPGGTRDRQFGVSRTTVEDLRPETGGRRTTNSTARSERQVQHVRGRVRERETLKWHLRDRCKGD